MSGVRAVRMPLGSPVVFGTALATAVSTVGVLPAYLAGALAPQIRADLGIGPAALGLALSACFISQSLFSARLGRIVDRLGAIASVRAAALATAIVAGTIAVATGSFAMLVVLLLATARSTASRSSRRARPSPTAFRCAARALPSASRRRPSRPPRCCAGSPFRSPS